LSNLKDTPSALKVWKNKDVNKMFETLNVLTHEEIHARYEIEVETYVRKREIEARVTNDIAVNHIIPAAIDYQTKLIDNVLGLKEVFSAAESKNLSRTQTDLIKQISVEINTIKDSLDKMNTERNKASKMDLEKQAEVYSNKVKPLMDAARDAADNLELITEDESWPLPKMRELLFTR
jgi:glutamine synthetase